jgi:hypothetical protein
MKSTTIRVQCLEVTLAACAPISRLDFFPLQRFKTSSSRMDVGLRDVKNVKWS